MRSVALSADRDVRKRKPDQLRIGLIAREVTFVAHRLAHACVQELDDIRRVDDLRTLEGKAKNGIIASQLRRQLSAMAGYLRPQGL